MKLRVTLCFLFLFITGTASAFKTSPSEAPPILDQWKSWVLYGMENNFCPTSCNDKNDYRCTWPTTLDIDLDQKGGYFVQHWVIYNPGWIPLPGDNLLWPQNVKVDGAPTPVVLKQGHPAIRLDKGNHHVDGYFKWTEMPEILPVPLASALVSLKINQKPVDFPFQDKKGRLWLNKQTNQEAKENRLDVQIYRLVKDSIPLQITTLFKINISGKSRKIMLDGAFFENFIPVEIQSPFPARLDIGGKLIIQGNPGHWNIEVLSYSKKKADVIESAKMPFGQEIWSFQSQNQLRMVKLLGIHFIDPQQTGCPLQWRHFPAFVVKEGDQIQLKEIRRGDPSPAPDQLSLTRTYWLDFNGKGFTIQDRITGTMHRQWYLAMNPPFQLGRVVVGGKNQLITYQGPNNKQGVELRHGKLNLTAEMRLKGSGIIPAVGWDMDFQTVSGSLNLPPGWHLLAAKGVDMMSGSWIEKWTLLDLFLILIISLSVFRVWNWQWGTVLTLITMILIYHEPGAPRLVWLHLIGTTALIRFLPDSWFKQIINLWRLGAIITILALSIPFMVQQIRWGVYPQLEPHDTPSFNYNAQQKGGSDLETVERNEGLPKAKQSETKVTLYSLKSSPLSDKKYPPKTSPIMQESNALIQTGPGLPDWKWRSFVMQWNGPVDRSHKIRLWLLSPLANLLLSLLRVILLAILIYVFIDIKQLRTIKKNFAFSTIVFFAVLLLPAISLAGTKSSDFPSTSMLNELRERLVKPPDCFPDCANSPSLELAITPESLTIQVMVHTAVRCAVPLPGSLDLWRPKKILVNSEKAKALMRDKEGLLWVLLPKKIHKITLIGEPPKANSFQLQLPLRPKTVSFKSEGWDILGVNKDGQVDASIKLIRKTGKDNPLLMAQSSPALSPFFHVQRLIFLSLEWKVITTITRITPLGSPISLQFPLFKGESVTTPAIPVENNMARIQMGPKKRIITFDSILKKEPQLILKAPLNVPLVETWLLDVSPVWHCSLSGIPQILHQDQFGNFKPKWQPWPGEEVIIQVSRPKAVPGQTVTINKASLTMAPGVRFTKSTLLLKIRSSQGAQHRILLPEHARLQVVKINNKRQPLKEKEREVIISLRPGSQKIEVEWHQDSDSTLITKSPLVDIGLEAVNAKVTFQMPKNRWILLTMGPRLGPAVLFWSYLFVIIIAAIALGRVSFTPLKTRHWLLLGLGLTQIHPLTAIMIAGWLLALGLRKKKPVVTGVFSFNLLQIILVFWSLAALMGLYFSIKNGLLGIPKMQIMGNNSSQFLLHWTQDRINSTMPQSVVCSLPILAYRLLMLLWALWLAHSLIQWLRWGWNCFGEGGLWKKGAFRIPKLKKNTPVPDEKPSSNHKNT